MLFTAKIVHLLNFVPSDGVEGAGANRGWVKMNTKHLVCFQAKGNQFGNFSNLVMSGLVGAIKLVHRAGRKRSLRVSFPLLYPDYVRTLHPAQSVQGAVTLKSGAPALYISRIDHDSTTTRLRLDYDYTTRSRLDYDSTTTRSRLDYDSTTTRPQLDYDSTTTRLRLDYDSTTTRPRLYYTTRSRLDYDSTTTRPRLDHNSTTTRPRLDHDSTTTRLRLDHDSNTTRPRLDHDYDSTTTRPAVGRYTTRFLYGTAHVKITWVLCIYRLIYRHKAGNWYYLPFTRNTAPASGNWYYLPFTNTATTSELVFADLGRPFYFPYGQQMRIWPCTSKAGRRRTLYA
ncbi:hypothetical protein QZH41_005526 [Actinostola sp. cb2023]|nr:hypothetical protein QZH41_005526 [Actinostola sp. cb2023]